MGSTEMTGAEALEKDYKDSLKSKSFLNILKSTRKYDMKAIQGFRDLAIQEKHLHLSAYLDIIVARSRISLSKFYNAEFLEKVEERTREYDAGIRSKVSDEIDYVVDINNPSEAKSFLGGQYCEYLKKDGFVELEQSLLDYDSEHVIAFREIIIKNSEVSFSRSFDAILYMRFGKFDETTYSRMLVQREGSFVGLYKEVADILSMPLKDVPMHLKPHFLKTVNRSNYEPFLECEIIEDIARYRLEKGI